MSMRTILKTIDAISEWAGRSARWLIAVLVLVISYDVAMRYLFDAPTMWAYETAIMLGATVYVLAWSYVHRHRSHVRVDVIYLHLPPRGRAAIDVIGNLFLFFPLIFVLINTSIIWARRAWLINEKSVESVWYPPVAPVRTLVALGLVLFALQGLAQFIRDLYFLIRNKPYD